MPAILAAVFLGFVVIAVFSLQVGLVAAIVAGVAWLVGYPLSFNVCLGIALGLVVLTNMLKGGK